MKKQNDNKLPKNKSFSSVREPLSKLEQFYESEENREQIKQLDYLISKYVSLQEKHYKSLMTLKSLLN